MAILYFVLLLVYCGNQVESWTNSIQNRNLTSRSGIRYPDELFYDNQRVNHFDGSDFRIWSQRYFVNDTFRAGNQAPLFLVLGGEAGLDPIWAVEGAWIRYAGHHGAVLVLLEHRYYGKSQPVHLKVQETGKGLGNIPCRNLTAENLQYLNSRQALSDTAKFLIDFRFRSGLSDGKVIVFGASYSGSLATWFRSKYSYLVDGVVASSAPIVADMEFMQYYVDVGKALDSTGERCQKEIKTATSTMYNWWGQPKKRELMQYIFKLCDKIIHNALLDLSVFFYNMAEHLADVIQNNKNNREFLGISGSNITIQTVCDIMTDESRGDSVHRYADVNSLFLEANKEMCLNLRYSKFLNPLNYTEIDRETVHKSGRQWLYQSCSEFGWFRTSWSMSQPFSLWFLFPFNFTTDQCNDLFKGPDGRFIYGWSQVTDKCDETNRYFGGRGLEISDAIFVDHEMDPWRNMTFTDEPVHGQNTQVIHVKGTAHAADIYPPSDKDSPELTQAREINSQTLAKCFRNCTEIWEKFSSAFLYKPLCDVPVEGFSEFVSLTDYPLPVNEALLWENVYLFVKRYTNNGLKYTGLYNTLPGYIGDGPYWCSDPDTADGMSPKGTQCPGWMPTPECAQSAVFAFWVSISKRFAEKMAGHSYVMLNASVEPIYANTTYLAVHELPYLRPGVVTKVTVLLVNESPEKANDVKDLLCLQDVSLGLCKSKGTPSTNVTFTTSQFSILTIATWIVLSLVRQASA